MKIAFFLDVKLVKINNKYYTTGAVDENYLNCHKINLNDSLMVVCRENTENHSKTKLAEASGKNISFITFKSYKNLLMKRNIIKNIILDSDFIFVKMPTNIGLIACYYLNKYKRKYVIEMVGSPFGALWNYGSMKAKLIAPIISIINRHYIKKAQNVIYVTKFYLQKYYPSKGKSIACSDVKIDIDIKNLEKRIKKIEELNEDSKIKIGLVGSLDTEYKGHRVAIKSLKYINNHTNQKYELHFLGAGNKKIWEKLAEKYKLKEQVVFDGTLPSGDAVYNWLDNIDIYVIPSYTEGLPRTLIEAMSRACPCIGSKVGGIPELINVTFRKKKYKQLAQGIINLLNDKEEMKKQAKINFENCKQYNTKNLETKRSYFIKNIISN